MVETRPMIENLSKKVVIKTIETRDGHVSKYRVYEALSLQYKYASKAAIMIDFMFFAGN